VDIRLEESLISFSDKQLHKIELAYQNLDEAQFHGQDAGHRIL